MLCESGVDERPPSDVKVVWMKGHTVMLCESGVDERPYSHAV